MLRRGQAMLPFFLLAWVLRLTQALASAHDRLQDEAAANSMSGTGNLDRGGNLSLATDLAIPYAEDLFSKQDYFSPNGKGELSEIAGYSADQQRQSLDHVFSESDATNDGLFDFSQHYRYDEDALEQPGFSNPDSDDFNSDLTKNSVPFAADNYPMASDSEGDVEHALFTDRSNDPDDFPEVSAYADLATSDKENVSNTATLDLNDLVNLAAEMGIGELGKELDSSDHKSVTYSETLGYDSAAFADLEKEGTDTLHPGVHSYHRKDQVTGDLNEMHVSSFDRSVLTDINLELDEALSPALKIASALNSPDLSGGPRVPSSIYDASIGPYGTFNRPITPPNPPPHSTGEPTTLASATTCNVADMAIKLFGGRLTDLKVRAAFIFVEVSKITQRCRYKVFERNGVVHFTTAFKGCNVKIQGGQYVLTLMWRNHYVHMSCPISTSDKPVAICGTSSMTITLPAGPVEALRVKNKLNKWVSIHQVAVKCKYQLLRDSEGRITFTTSYNGCHVRRSMDRYFYNIYYQMAPGKLGQAVMSCRTGINVTVPPEASLPSVFCAKSGMIIKLPKGRLDAVKVIDGFGKAIPVGSIAKKCNYQLFQMKTGHIILIASFQSCQVAFVDGCFALNIKFQHADRVMGEVSALCHAGGGPKPTSQPDTPTTRDVTSSILSTVIPADVSATICNKDGMTVVLPNGPWWGIRVKDLSGKEITVTSDFAERCHYNLSLNLEKIIFTTTYTGCFVEQVGDRYVLTVLYRTATWNRGSVRMECPTSAGSPTELPPLSATVGKPISVCRSSNMTVVLPAGSLEKVLVLDHLNRPVKVIDAPKSCNYSMVERRGQILFTAPYSACDVKILNGNYVLAIMYTSYSGGFASVQMECPTTGEPTKPPPSTKPIPPTPVCGASSMIVELPEGPLEQVKIMNASNGLWVAVKDVPKNCNYTLMKERGRNLFITSYKACHVWILNKNYVLTVIYTTATGVRGMVQMTCPAVETTSLTTRSTTIGKPVTTGKPTKPTLPPTPVCKASSMTVALPSGSLQVLLLNLSNEWVDIDAAPSYCNYSLVQGRGGRNFFTAPYRACDVRIQNGNYMLTLLYITAADKRGYLDIRCPTTGGEPTETTSPSGGELTGTTAGETTTTWKPTMPTLPDTALCRASSMTVELPSELLQVLLLSPSNEWVDISNAPSYCNYSLVQGGGGRNFFTTPYRACDVRIQDGSYILTLLYITIAKGGYVHMRCPIKTTTKPTKTSRTTTRKTTSIATVGVTEAPATVVCTASSMVVELPKEPLRLVKVLDKSNRWVAVIDAPKYCNYTLLQGRGGNFFITPYTACDVRILNNNYVLKIWYLATGGKKGYMVMKCPTDAGEPTKAPTTTWEPTKSTRTTIRRTTTTTIGEPTRTTSRRPTRTTSRRTTTTTIGEPTRTTSRRPTRTTSRRTTTTTIGEPTRTTSRRPTRTTSRRTTTTTIGEPTRTTSRKTTSRRPTRTTSRRTTITTIGEPTRTTSRKTTSRRPTRTTSRRTTTTTIGEPTRTTSRKTTSRRPTRTTSRRTTTTTIGEPTRTTSRKTTSRRPTRTTSRRTTTTIGEPTRTTSRRTTTTTIGEPTRTTSRRPTRTTSRRTTTTTIGEPTRTTSRKTTSRRPTRTTSRRTTITTIGEPTRTTSRRPTRTTSRRTTTTTIGEPTRTTSRKTTSRRPTRTTSRRTTTTTIGEPTRTTSRKTTSRRPTRTTSRRTTTTTIGEPTRTTSRKTTSRRPTRTTSRRTTITTIGEPTRTTSRKTTSRRPTRTTSRRTTTTTIGEPTRTTSRKTTSRRPTRTTSRRTTITTIGEPTRTTSRKTTSRRPTRTTSRRTTTTIGEPTRTTSRRTTTTTIGEPTRTTSRKTTSRRPTRTTSRRTTTTTIGEPTRTTSRRPTRTTSRRTTTTTIGEPTRTTSRRPTRTTSRRTTTTIGEPTRTTSRRTTTGEPTKTTSKRTTTTIGETTRTTSRRTTTGRTTTTIGEPTRTTSRKTTTTTIGEPTRTTIGKTTKAPTTVVCTASSMVVELPNEPLRLVKVLDKSNQWVAVIDAPKYCNYTLLQGRGGNFFITPYTACDVRILNNNYVLKIWYLTTGGIKGYVVMKCPTSAGEPTKAPTTTPTTWARTKPTRTTGIATKTTVTTTGGEPTVVCTASSMVVELSKEPLVLVELLAESSKWVAVIDAPEDCNYTLVQSRERNFFKTPYMACDVKILNENYFLALRYTTIDGKVGYVQMKCPTSAGEPTKDPATTNTTRKSTRTPPAPDVVCNSSGMMVELPKDSLDLVELLDYANKWVVVNKAPMYCNYTLLQGSGRTLFITPYKACDVRILNENYILTLRYTTSGQQVYVHMKCPTSAAAPTKTPSSTTTTGKPPIPTVCKASVMTIELPEGPIEQVALIDKSNTLVTVKDDTRKCGYSLVHGRGKNLFTTPYTACDVKMLNGNYVLTLAYVTLTGERVLVQMKCPVSAALPTGLPLPPFGVSVLCSDTCMTVELPGGLLQDIQLMDESNNLVAVTSAPKTCGLSLVRGNGKNILTAPYKACNVKILNNFYILRVIYTTLTGERGDIQAKCPVPGLVPREGCKIPRSQQVACGPPNADPQLCVANGCCVDATTSQCYYPLNACTADGHFVFSVDRTSTKPEIDPGSLVIAGNRSCAPVICTPDFAIFKFPVTGCGTHVFTVAETTIYLAEVHGLVRGNQQMYGQITRDGPYRFQVECRYSKGHLASTGYLVVNPPPPSAALAFGSLGVRLRIATDTSYTSFYPRSHLPLSFLLGSKVYLEVQLVNPPNPNVVLLVHYCIAYPQSSQAAWVILYEGCPNILDYSSAAGLHVKYNNMPVSKHTRRFEIQSFQFLDYKTKQHLDEEIYFMCSTEVCSPEHRVCNEGCFDGRDMPVPVDLGVGGRCAGKPCPGKSNVVKRAAHGHTGLIAVGEGTFLLDEPVPHEQMEKHWTHFHGLLGLLALLVSVSVVMLFLKKWVVLQMARS
ncbi:uncharacterized protein LOC117972885 [Acipenser ruthenus]|uniref:uncharacterized protein LOC117972885 n=1 Tax=Acipenser ruthenus TaxID=7906 RepID=UPI002740A17B|nr:uncharacterized protein LOC117972885 [Acipenser ruthenus]